MYEEDELMARGKKGLMLISTLITVYLLIFVMGQHDTSAWFVSETKAHGYIENAKTEDLLFKTSEVISYETGGIVTVKVEIKNISEVEVPIQLEGDIVNLSPEETFSEVFHEKVPMDVTEINFQLTGFNNYISELITIQLDQKLLLATALVEQEKDIEVKDLEPDDAKLESEELDKLDKIPEPENIEKIPEPENIEKIPGPENIEKIPGPENIEKIPEPENIEKITEPENKVDM